MPGSGPWLEETRAAARLVGMMHAFLMLPPVVVVAAMLVAVALTARPNRPA
ncbi:MAG TPA: hypothetical protein VGJ25_06455 [Gaiellaceae bacterium]